MKTIMLEVLCVTVIILAAWLVISMFQDVPDIRATLNRSA